MVKNKVSGTKVRGQGSGVREAKKPRQKYGGQAADKSYYLRRGLVIASICLVR